MNDLVNHLEICAGMIAKSLADRPQNGTKDYAYQSVYDFVLRAGEDFEYKPKPAEVPWGKEHGCFMNAYHLADDENYFYVEGYACGMIPVAHAWCVDRNGNVVDNTWRDAEEPRYYRGVKMPLRYVDRVLCEKGTYGVIDDWQNEWPIFKKTWPGYDQARKEQI